MSAYLAQLRKYTEEQNSIQQLKTEAEAIKVLQLQRRAKPLNEQIVELMRTLPPQLRDRPWSIAELVNRLQGKYRDRPHTQHIGIALRQLGWRRERRWGQGFDGARVWIPPPY
jgi:hypothetical protein